MYHYLIACENLRYGKKTVVVADQNELDGRTKVKVVVANYIFRLMRHMAGNLWNLTVVKTVSTGKIH